LQKQNFNLWTHLNTFQKYKYTYVQILKYIWAELYINKDKIDDNCEWPIKTLRSVSELNEFKPRLKSPKKGFQLGASLNLEKLNSILSGTNNIWATV